MNLKSFAIWIGIALAASIIGLIFFPAASIAYKALMCIAILITAVFYVISVKSSKQSMCEKMGEEISILKYFLLDKSMLFVGIGLVLFSAKLILEWMGINEAVTGSIHLISLGFILLSMGVRNKKTKDNEEVNES